MTRATVREATHRDHAAIRAIAAAANEEFREPMGEVLYAGYLANVLDLEDRARRGSLLVAELDGEVVGTITLYRDIHDEGMPVAFPAGTAGIRATAVKPSARGHGIGSALVEAAISGARAERARAIALHTSEDMRAAMRLYERHGFRREPDHDYVANGFFAADGGRTLVAVAFVLDLADER